MKQLFTLFIFINSLTTYGQLMPQCLPAPDLDFGGVHVYWAYTVEDSIIPHDKCQGITFDYHRADAWAPPMEYKDKIITSFYGLVRGSHLYGIDKASGHIDYHITYNEYNTDLGVGYIMPHLKMVSDTLECIGFEGSPATKYNLRSVFWSGFPRIKKFDMNTGELISDFVPPYDTIAENYISLNTEVYPEFWPNDSLITRVPLDVNYILNGDSVSIQFFPDYINYKTLKKFKEVNTLPNGGGKPSFIRYTDENGILQGKVFRVSGPFSMDNHHMVYFVTVEGKKQDYYKRIELDVWGNLVSNEDVTDRFCDMGLYDFISDVREIAPNTVRFILGTYNGPLPLGQAGYVDVDLEGNCLRSHPKIAIGTMKPTSMRSLNLKGTKDILHCMAPWDKKDLYFYREDGTTGEFTKVGELINPNHKPDSNYVFIPTFMMQTEEGDLFLELETRLTFNRGDFSWLIGGWQQMLLVSGQDLGITVATDDGQNMTDNVLLSPNPCHDRFTIQLPSDAKPIHLDVLNAQGCLIQSKDFDANQREISLFDYPAGLYFVSIKLGDETVVKKVVKI
ncbi:MAG: T9SS type A sorting domain-containing protein [Lewinellaceae bacterium]|nr:T9SS type A sorting domain-containing protein [Lewinellaceae bacterium]